MEDGESLLDGAATVVHAPGHTPGSIALHFPERRLLLAGDAVASLAGRPVPGFFNIDRPAALTSFRRLAALDVSAVGFGHGPPLVSDASVALRAAAEKV